ncbi:MAG TPA: ankyrin repeat domain-containing protein [Verrucomicrobiae bacterium]|jgi:ankyrin repeat protein
MNKRSFCGILITLACSHLAFCGEIHDAARDGDLVKVKTLLKDNPDLVFSKDIDGKTPLHWAVMHDRMDAANFLLTQKANVNAKEKTGLTPLHWAAMKCFRDMAELLLSKKAEVNSRSIDGRTPLDWAAAQDCKDVAELLLANKAKVNVKTYNGFTPLHTALFFGHTNLVNLLRQHGARE